LDLRDLLIREGKGAEGKGEGDKGEREARTPFITDFWLRCC